MYSLLIDEDVLSELSDKKSYEAKIHRQITTKILSLLIEQTPHDCKQIMGGYRVDTGEYRIYYELDEEQEHIIVRLVGKRNDDEVYERLRRKLGR